jgi:hypothetical protein
MDTRRISEWSRQALEKPTELTTQPEPALNTIRVVVAATHPSGHPGFCPVNVQCTELQYEQGEHYEAAKENAQESGYEGPDYVAFDEKDGPAWLFANVDWSEAQTVTV